MRIKFKAPDPRAGLIAQMDSHRGQQLIDAGAAVRVKEDGSDIAAAPAPVVSTPEPPTAPSPPPTSAPAPVAVKSSGKGKK